MPKLILAKIFLRAILKFFSRSLESVVNRFSAVAGFLGNLIVGFLLQETYEGRLLYRAQDFLHLAEKPLDYIFLGQLPRTEVRGL